MAKEQTLVLIKPDALVKNLTGNILTELSRENLKIIGSKVVVVSDDLFDKHYFDLKERKGEQIYNEVKKHMTGEFHGQNKIIAFVYEGEGAVKKIKDLAGETHPDKADNSTIRGKYGKVHTGTKCFETVIHASATPEEAEKEIKVWFEPNELISNIYPTEEKEINTNKLHWK